MKLPSNLMSVRNKLGFAIFSIFTIVLILLTVYTYITDRQSNLEQAVSNVRGMNGFYFDSLNTLMLADGMEEREALRNKFLELPNILDVKVVRGDAIVKRFGKGLTAELPVDDLDAKALSGEPVLQYGETNGHRTITIIEPYRASHDTRGTDCLECHKRVDEGTVLGAVRVQYSLQQADQQVIAELWKKFAMMSISVVVGLLALMLLLNKMIVKPINLAKNFANAVSHGDLNQVVINNSADEMGQLTQSLNDMQANLKNRIEVDKQLVAEGQRISAALNNASACIMVASADHKIIFTNAAMNTLFKMAEKDIRAEIPGFNTDHILQTNINQFFKQQNQHNIPFDSLTTTFEKVIVLGRHTLKIIASPVLGEDGVRLGTVLEWEDRTKQLAIEEEIDALVEASNSGNLSARLTTEGKTGFFLQLSSGFNALLDQLSNVFDDIGSVMGRVAEGDLAHKMTAQYQGVFDEVKCNINNTISNMEMTVSKLSNVSVAVGSSAEEISDGNTNLAARTEQQSTSLEEIASSVEELTSTVKNTAQNTQQANQIAMASREQAEKGGDIVARAVKAMSDINGSSNKISEIIGVINEIAFQTNLLALNASVEAARAGEQGRGFAVVAAEVRNLASRSADAAKEIKELIQDSSHKVEIGSDLVSETGKNLDMIVEGVKKVDNIIAEITSASQEQSVGIDQVSVAISKMDDMTQQNATLAEQAKAASVSMSKNSQEMRKIIDFFELSGSVEDRLTLARSSKQNAPRAKLVEPAIVVSSAKTEPGNKSFESDEEWEEF